SPYLPPPVPSYIPSYETANEDRYESSSSPSLPTSTLRPSIPVTTEKSIPLYPSGSQYYTGIHKTENPSSSTVTYPSPSYPASSQHHQSSSSISGSGSAPRPYPVPSLPSRSPSYSSPSPSPPVVYSTTPSVHYPSPSFPTPPPPSSTASSYYSATIEAGVGSINPSYPSNNGYYPGPAPVDTVGPTYSTVSYPSPSSSTSSPRTAAPHYHGSNQSGSGSNRYYPAPEPPYVETVSSTRAPSPSVRPVTYPSVSEYFSGRGGSTVSTTEHPRVNTFDSSSEYSTIALPIEVNERIPASYYSK
ncbi:hypothetical protein PFISCL1PPCAC_15418, partial [Pristionchus fissidentatus]